LVIHFGSWIIASKSSIDQFRPICLHLLSINDMFVIRDIIAKADDSIAIAPGGVVEW
jgi:hypothetical protein